MTTQDIPALVAIVRDESDAESHDEWCDITICEPTEPERMPARCSQQLIKVLADALEAEHAARLTVEWDSEHWAQYAVRAEADIRQLRELILDIDAHATPYGDIPDEPGWVGTYLVTAGAIHRALGKIGYSDPSCAAEQERDALRVLLLRIVSGWDVWRRISPEGIVDAKGNLFSAINDARNALAPPPEKDHP